MLGRQLLSIASEEADPMLRQTDRRNWGGVPDRVDQMIGLRGSAEKALAEIDHQATTQSE
jgi:hypothetical protein